MAKRIRFERGQELQERARMVAAICIQPHVRKRITPRQLLPLPWDNKKSEMRNNALSSQPRKGKRGLRNWYRKLNETSFIEFAVCIGIQSDLSI